MVFGVSPTFLAMCLQGISDFPCHEGQPVQVAGTHTQSLCNQVPADLSDSLTHFISSHSHHPQATTPLALCLSLTFTFRFFIEYTKENQVSFEDGMLFNMGQLLSLPFVLLGAFCMYRALANARRK